MATTPARIAGTSSVELGLDTFGDVTVDADGRAVPYPQVIRDVVAEAVLADELGIDFIGVGERAVASHRLARRVGAPCSRSRGALRGHRGAATARVGRRPGRAAQHRVLAGAQLAAARPAPLRAGGCHGAVVGAALPAVSRE